MPSLGAGNSSAHKYARYMRIVRYQLLLCLIAGMISAWIAVAQHVKTVYVVTHIDVIPPSGGLSEINKLLLQYAADSRKDPGSIRFDVLVQDGRLNHFTFVEEWQSREAFEAHNAAAHTRAFREKLHPSPGSPFDERVHNLLQ